MSAARLIVEVPWGPQAGLKVAVAPGERLRVGRNDRADLAIPTDELLLAVHFELTWDGAACKLRDLGKGVKVGGAPVTEADLTDGAWIRAGSTDFMVRIEGSYPSVEPDDDDDDDELDEEALAARQRAREDREQQRVVRAGIAAALGEIARTEHLHAVLDAARDDRILQLVSASPDRSRSLYEGAQGDAMAGIAPHLVRFSPGSALLERLVLEGWGARWGIFLTSTQPFKELRRHLRRFLLVEDDETGEELYFRFYDPEVLRVFLPTCLPRQAEELWSDIDAFLFEDEGGSLVRKGREAALAAAGVEAR